MRRIKFPFKISEFIIEKWAIPQRVADALLDYHILEILPFRTRTNYPVTAAQHSGYRSPAYEKRKKRKYTSEHTFIRRRGKTGAVDWTCVDKRHNAELLKYLINESSYTRIAFRGTEKKPISIHCDYRPVDKRQLFTYNSKGEWIFIRNLK